VTKKAEVVVYGRRIGRGLRWWVCTVLLGVGLISFALLFIPKNEGVMPALEHGELAVLTAGVTCAVIDATLDLRWVTWIKVMVPVCIVGVLGSVFLLVAFLAKSDRIAPDLNVILSAGVLAFMGIFGAITAAILDAEESQSELSGGGSR
jgi:hypothetical protein